MNQEDEELLDEELNWPDLSKQTVFEALQSAAHQNSIDHGFWDGEVNIPEKLALIHSEVSEALEDYRKGNMTTGLLTIPTELGKKPLEKPIGFPSELADIVIRVLDLSQYLNIDLADEIVLKMEFNKTRSHKHGKVC